MEVWPEHWPTFQIFFEVSNQWRCGPSGPIGLDYAVVYNVLSHKQIVGDERDALMDNLKVIEGAAMKELNKS